MDFESVTDLADVSGQGAIQEISVEELDEVAGGGRAISATFGAGAVLTRAIALVPGPHQPFAGALSLVFTAGGLAAGALGY